MRIRSLLLAFFVVGTSVPVLGGAREEVKVERDVRTALSLNGTFANNSLTVRISKGVVHLTGKVDSQAERDLATEIATSQAWPYPVRNEIQVEPPSGVKKELALAHQIERALHAHPDLEGDDVIEVQVQKDQVTLSGIVTRWKEYDLVAQIASDQGAKEVINRVQVRNAISSDKSG